MEGMKEKIVIIGAGKTGRGFVARLVRESGRGFVLTDRDPELIGKLSGSGEYGISFFHGGRPDLRIGGFGAFQSGSAGALEALCEADIIFVSVGSSNFPDVSVQLEAAVRRRSMKKPGGPCTVFTCENAVRPAAKLRSLVSSRLSPGSGEAEFFASHYDFSECTVFCSTIESRPGSLDIVSEDYNELQFDADAVRGTDFPVRGMVPVVKFENFLSRKIYTYNCASAAIAYLGALKGYTAYSDAANDPDILKVLGALYEETNAALCAEYGYDERDQKAFAERSLAKFRDPAIEDTIDRNARDVLRKLAPDDRLIGPARLMQKHGIVPRAVALVIAAALLYDAPSETALETALREKGVKGIVKDVCGVDPASGFGALIMRSRDLLSQPDGRTRFAEALD